MSVNPSFKLIQLSPISTEGKPGQLIDLNITKICKENSLDFVVSKCFYINQLNSPLSRGNHSNNNAIEFMVCVTGSFTLELFDGKTNNVLEITANQAVFINKNIWINFHNFDNCVIFAFVCIEASEKDSCYSKEEFIQKQNVV